MARMRRERTMYDLQAWELIITHADLVLIVQDSESTILAVDLCSKIHFKPRDLGEDNIYTILPFDKWVAGFSKHHRVSCWTLEDVREFYRKEGAKLW
jgi:hypothetical protein